MQTIFINKLCGKVDPVLIFFLYARFFSLPLWEINMKSFKKYLTAAAVAAAMFTSTGAFADDTITLRLGFVDPASSSYAMGGQKFADECARLTDGKVQVKVLAGGTLGGEREMYEGAQMGTMDMVSVVNTVLSQFIPEMVLLDQPFLFDTVEQAHAAVDGKLGQLVAEKAAAQGIHIIGWLESGFRDTFSKNPIKSVDDFKGVKIRTMENKMQIAAFNAVGAIATPMPATEQYTALQQGTIDAQENPLSIIDSNKLYEVQHYISLTGHVFSPHCLYINQARFDSLEPDLQQALLKAAAAYQTAQRARATELNALSVQKFKDAGCEVIEVTDAEKDQWRQMAIDGKVYDLVREKMEHPELLDKILNKEY